VLVYDIFADACRDMWAGGMRTILSSCSLAR
jgi:hypothetical protein